MEAVEIYEKSAVDVGKKKQKRKPVKRPKTSAEVGKPRNRTIKVKAYDDEVNEWSSKASASGFGTIAGYIRQLLVDERQGGRRVTPADPELIRQLSWIGNNLNQIARKVNQAESVESELSLDLMATLVSIEHHLKELRK